MAVTSKSLYRGAASTTTTTTLYTVPNSSTTTVVTNIVVTNTSASAQTFTLTIDSVDIFTTAAIAANTTALFDLKQVIPANATPKTIKGGASAITVNFHISGVEIA
jgi:hypothetical protein